MHFEHSDETVLPNILQNGSSFTRVSAPQEESEMEPFSKESNRPSLDNIFLIVTDLMTELPEVGLDCRRQLFLVYQPFVSFQNSK